MIARRYRLWCWLVRALIPEGLPGTYVLWDEDKPRYVGRSDTNLRRRLLEHSLNWPGAYFTFDVAHGAGFAFDMECSLFHALSDQTVNRNHPQRPTLESDCPFCAATVKRITGARLAAPGSVVQ